MDEGQRQGGQEIATDAPAPEAAAEQRTPDEIRRDIKATREDLGETVEALVEKADVKAQVSERVDAVKDDARQKVDDLRGKVRDAAPNSAGGAAADAKKKARANPLPLVGAGALVVGFALGRLTARN